MPILTGGAPVEEAYADWLFSRRLFKAVSIGLNAKQTYELSNILERLYISIGGDQSRLSNFDSDEFKKMVDELEEKQLPTTKILNIIEKHAKEYNSHEERAGRIEFDPKTATLRYKTFKTGVPMRFLRITGTQVAQLAEMLIKYAMLQFTGSQQWSISQRAYRTMYVMGLQRFGEVYEGFASPLNSKLYRLPNAHYCSLFGGAGEPDAAFGSAGQFEDVAASEGVNQALWIINPPFAPIVMERAVDTVIRRRLPAIVYLPNWRDYEPLIRLERVIPCTTIILPRGKYNLDMGAGKEKPAPFEAKLFFVNFDASKEEIDDVKAGFVKI